jgi:hydroxyacylglutathione hydrolase
VILEYLTVGPFQENSYILGDESSNEAILIDPGHEPERILDRVAELGVEVLSIVNTHAHIDHVGGVNRIQEKLGVPFRLHRGDLPLLNALPQQATMFGLPPIQVPRVDSYLTEGERFTVGKIDVLVMETPGHSPGHITLVVNEKDLIVGDVLFAGSVGRTDLPGGNYETLFRSIRDRLFPLGDDCVVWPGHGPTTTIGEEKRSNPFVGLGPD